MQLDVRRMKQSGTVRGPWANANCSHVWINVRDEDGNSRDRAIGLDGQVVVDSAPPCAGLDREGARWFVSDDRASLERVLPDGSRQQISPGLGEDQVLGHFVIVDDGVLVMINKNRGRNQPPQLARLLSNGSQVWSRTIDRFDRDLGNPIIVHRDRALVAEPFDDSGACNRVCLDVESGEVHWSTSLQPSGYAAVAPGGDFLVGTDGYGQRRLERVDRKTGEVKAKLHGHGPLVVTGSGAVWVINWDPHKMGGSKHAVARRLEPDGTSLHGPALPNAMGWPVVTRDGTLICLSDGELVAIDTAMQKQTLYTEPAWLPEAPMGRMLILDDGTLAYGFADELVFIRGDMFAPAASPWPCSNGTLEGNPFVT